MPLPPQAVVRPALLAVLADLGGRAQPAQIYPAVTARFPGITPAEFSGLLKDGRTSRWTNRIQFARQDLVAAGLIDPSEWGVWQLTAAGWTAAREAGAPLSGSPASVAADDGEDAEERFADSEEAPPLPPTTPERCIAALRAASVDAAHPERLEIAVGDAFRLLGFEVDQLGGSGRTDVLVAAEIGAARYVVVVDAKATGHDRVTDAQVNWLAVRQHRDDTGADYACLVGRAFAGGALPDRARELGIVLLTTGELEELVSLAAATPFTLAELRALFAAAPFAADALPRLRQIARARRRFQALIGRVLVLIDAFNRLQPGVVLARSDTLLGTILANADDALADTTLEEVQRVLALLTAVGVLLPSGDGGSLAQTSPAGARQMLMSAIAGV